MPDMVSEECESERHRTHDLSRHVGCATDEVRVSVLMVLQTRSLSFATFTDVWSLGLQELRLWPQIDIAHVKDHSARSPTLLDSLALPHTNLRDAGRIGVQILPSDDRGAEECNSAGSESAEREDIDDEEVEWGGQVRQRRVVLVPEEAQGTPQSVQDSHPVRYQ